jgi:hypothetical protein
MKTKVVIIGPSLESLLQISLLLDKRSYSIFVIEAKEPVGRLLLDGTGDPDAVVLHLTGSENVVDLRRLFDVLPHTRFLFLVKQLPLHAAVARIIASNGSTVLRSDESPVFAVATLVALLVGEAEHRPGSLRA